MPLIHYTLNSHMKLGLFLDIVYFVDDTYSTIITLKIYCMFIMCPITTLFQNVPGESDFQNGGVRALVILFFL